MIKMRDLLDEISSGNVLYHIITEENFQKVLHDDILSARSFQKFQLSFTRDKSYSYVPGTFEKRYVRFHVDRNKLQSKFKIKNYNDPSYKHKTEKEEQVVGPINNFGKYLIAIEFISKSNDIDRTIAHELRMYVKKYPNIKIINPPDAYEDINKNSSGQLEGIYELRKGLISKLEYTWEACIKKVLETNKDPFFEEIRNTKDEPWSDYGHMQVDPYFFIESIPDNFAAVKFDTSENNYSILSSGTMMENYIQKLYPKVKFSFHKTESHYEESDE